jgi:hypothetical protein
MMADSREPTERESLPQHAGWEPKLADLRIGAVDGHIRFRCAGIAASVLILLLGGCTSPQTAQMTASPSVAIHTFTGGCAGTVLTDAEPPVWAQSGFQAKGTPWPVPWAFGTQNTAVAFVFSKVLVAGSGPRVDGTYNKVRFVAKADYPNGYMNVAIQAHALGESQPILTFTNAGSAGDFPKPGCWTFRLSWSAHGQAQVSTINLEVLPAGTVP